MYFDRRGSWSLSALGAWDINGPKIGIDHHPRRDPPGPRRRGQDLRRHRLRRTRRLRAGIRCRTIGAPTYRPRSSARATRPSVSAPSSTSRSKRAAVQLFFRYVHDIDVQTRPEAQLFFAGIAIRAWKPSGAPLDQPTDAAADRHVRRIASSGTAHAASLRHAHDDGRYGLSRWQEPSTDMRLAPRAARRCARRSRGRGTPSSTSRAASDPIALLEEQERSRVAELVPVRHGRMMASPFAFFRGAALVMASDLAQTPRTGIIAQICGDAHLVNFGVFGTPERSLVFDVNDFDETLPGPWEWDVKRLAASLEIAARSNGFAKHDRRGIVLEATRCYRETMAEFAAQDNFAVWYARLDIEAFISDFEKLLTRPPAQAGREGHRQGAPAGQRPRARQADRGRRRRAPHRQPAAVDRAAPRRRRPGGERGVRDPARAPDALVRRDPVERSARLLRAVSVRRAGAQGRRRRQRRHALLDRAVRRGRRR